MTPEEENYEEALRRIKKAKETEAVELNLRWLKISREGSLVVMNRLPQELADLASLRRLDLSDSLIRSHQFSDLSPLAGLTSLQSLNLAGCEQLSDLTPLAGLASLQSLDLSGPFFGSSQLSDLSPLAGLTSLQALNLSWCRQLRDLSPLAGLSSLQKLDIEGCEQLSDLSLLASLTSLQVLHLSKCLGIRRFAPLKSLLPTLKQLYLFGCKLDDLPP